MRSMNSEFEWTDDTIRELRRLWSEGHSTAEIGRRMGISKNAVVGKAHRLDLPARPSPIRTGGSPRLPRAPRRQPVPRLADTMPLSSLARGRHPRSQSNSLFRWSNLHDMWRLLPADRFATVLLADWRARYTGVPLL